jgi:uncharacterized protein YndB with AHSA1/START domain
VGGTCELRLTRRYAAAPSEVWAALTEPESVARWLAPPPGVSLRTVEPERVLELDWRPPGEEPSVVRVEVTPDGEGTKLVLDHRRIDAAAGMRNMRIWTHRLERLTA